MPIDPSIPLQGKRPDMLGKMSDLLNVQRSKVALRSEEQSQGQREALAKFDVQKLIGEDGTIDLNKIPESGLREAAGDQFPDVLSKYAGIRQQQLQAKSMLTALTNEQRQAFGEMTGALRSDPDVAKDTPEGRQKVADTFGQYAEMFPDAVPVLRAYGAPIQNAPKGKMAQVLQNIQLQATSAGDQASRQAPEYANVGPELKQTNPYAQAGQAPGSIPLGLSPGERFPLTTTATGQLARADRVAGTVAPLGGTNPTEAQAASQAANVPRVQQNITEAAGVPAVRNVLQNIIKLSDSVTTGPKSERVNRIKAMVGNVIPGASGWQDDASAYQEMTKYMEQLALRSWASAGGSGTNSQLEAQVRANPNNEYNSKTVKELAKWVLAGEEAKLAKAKSMATWLKQEGNSVNNIEQFELQWAEAMDPRVFQLKGMSSEEAKQKFSKEERAEMRKSVERLRALGGVEN
jgi:hypothetical protein